MNELLSSLGNECINKIYEDYESTAKIICYNCGYLKVMNKRIEGQIIKCPKCGYEFFYDSSVPLISDEKEETIQQVNKPRKRGWKRLFGL